MRLAPVVFIGCLVGIVLSATVAAQAGADPATGAIGGLLVYGPLGAFCAWLMWRDRVRDTEHRQEREAAWRGVATLEAKHDETNVLLARIETLLRERDP